MAGLIQCSRDKTHQYPSHVGACPYCAHVRHTAPVATPSSSTRPPQRPPAQTPIRPVAPTPQRPSPTAPHKVHVPTTVNLSVLAASRAKWRHLGRNLLLWYIVGMTVFWAVLDAVVNSLVLGALATHAVIVAAHIALPLAAIMAAPTSGSGRKAKAMAWVAVLVAAAVAYRYCIEQALPFGVTIALGIMAACAASVWLALRGRTGSQLIAALAPGILTSAYFAFGNAFAWSTLSRLGWDPLPRNVAGNLIDHTTISLCIAVAGALASASSWERAEQRRLGRGPAL